MYKIFAYFFKINHQVIAVIIISLHLRLLLFHFLFNFSSLCNSRYLLLLGSCLCLQIKSPSKNNYALIFTEKKKQAMETDKIKKKKHTEKSTINMMKWENVLLITKTYKQQIADNELCRYIQFTLVVQHLIKSKKNVFVLLFL